ncbi:MAG TPA: Hpt domain-containing protein [Candidatus Krumholzibacteria bacterium]|nr:Hpt domain-containing protein [Candidatus Krumholzibacteria bacterium]HPD70762.1 Hpt domain-containing protein [Candidatus Krumholzibacteria bacterium]HRY39538.1 Hpt domain-containing protein [Candidatus Krumholzibacteria bacterium]
MATIDVAPDLARVLDVEGTLDNLGGDLALLRELIDFFLELAPKQLDDLQAVVDAGDVAAVDLQAHAMKGGAANVGAVKVSATARELEMLAKGGGLAGAAEIFARLRAEFTTFQRTLAGVDWDRLA